MQELKSLIVFSGPAAEVGEELPGRVLGLALKAPEGGRCYGGLGVPGNGQIHLQVRSSLAPLSQGAAVSGWRAGKQKQNKNELGLNNLTPVTLVGKRTWHL